jgi:hypothetical protein
MTQPSDEFVNAETMLDEQEDEVVPFSERTRNGRARDLRFTLKPFDEITLSTTPNYLVKGIIPRVGLVVVWGPPKCGKSFWTFDAVMHVALGWSYRGHRVRQGTVVYLALEGGHGFRNRIEAWRRRHLNGRREPVPFYLLDVPVDLVADRDKLIEEIRAQLGIEVPSIVVIDTLNRAMLGDENKSDDMAKFIRAADVVRTAFGCVVIVIHHCGVAKNRPRGHTSLAGADDAQIAVERDKGGNITVTIEHMKDGEASEPMGSRLELVKLGVDDDGDQMSSCVIVPSVVMEKKAKKDLPATAKLALDQFRKLIAKKGEIPPTSEHIPPDTKVCLAAEWRDSFYNAYAGEPDTKRKAFVRATLKLQEANLIGIYSDKAWLVGTDRTFRTKPDIEEMSAEMSGERMDTDPPGQPDTKSWTDGQDISFLKEMSGVRMSGRSESFDPTQSSYGVLGRAPAGSRCTLCGEGGPERIKHAGHINLWHRDCAERYLTAMADPPSRVPQLPPDPLDEHGVPQGSVSQGRIREFARDYLDRAVAQHQREGNVSGDVNSNELDAWLRATLRQEVSPEHVEIEFERVMRVVFSDIA